MIEAKREGRQLKEAPEPAARPGQLVDLMAALQESVGKARGARRDGAPEAPIKRAPEGTLPELLNRRRARGRSPRQRIHWVSAPGGSSSPLRRGRVAS
jgi:DNA end-binding protein Ku